ncbi:putative UDP-rhamnose:rhamnosyltransferase 1 [Senna tora]|uniref:Putative UDP-rhamnose:rhamnosyltransferase 1 n=1 Tax=Senna tora TaxID=362788 RepID=A0A834X2B5_9FABA|nr:putative UDP-rhamnose:rhamnosyltransferase 1 [Senna tora]
MATQEVVNVVMLPWSAFGHMIPFFHLSIALARSGGVHVSLVSTPRNIERLPNVPSDVASLITLVSLPMPEFPNGELPKGAEATIDIPFEKLPYLNMAYDLLQHPFHKLVAQESPDWIIVDFMPYWVIDIAKQHQIPLMHFSVFSTSTQVFSGPPEYLVGEGKVRVRPSMESLMSPPSWVDFPSSVAFKKHEARFFFDGFYDQNNNGTEVSVAQRLAQVLKNCQAVCVRTCNEYEGLYVNFVSTNDESWKQIFKWLDEQKPESVVFVGFGSECKFKKEEVHEIAYGLELSEMPFLWCLRKPDWANDETQALPHGFGGRTRGRGVVKIGWAPQMEILGHPSIGGSLFHSGWGSIIETLQFGHCLVLLPMVYDQGLNARLLVEKGLGVEIDRGEDGSFGRYDIAKALRTSMLSKTLRSRAREVAAIFGDRKLHQEHYIGELVRFFKSHKA